MLRINRWDLEYLVEGNSIRVKNSAQRDDQAVPSAHDAETLMYSVLNEGLGRDDWNMD